MAPKKETNATRPSKKTAKSKTSSASSLNCSTCRWGAQALSSSPKPNSLLLWSEFETAGQRLFNEVDQAAPSRRRSKSKMPSRRRERETSSYLTPGDGAAMNTFAPTGKK
jgi:hypothetical protein